MKIIDYPIIKVNIKDIQPNKYNPKRDFFDSPANKEEFEKLKKSLQYNGYQTKIDVREIDKNKYEIVDGFHRYCALKDLGFEGEIQVTNLGKQSLEQAIASTLALEDIKVGVDGILEAKLLKKLKDDGKLELVMNNLPFDMEIIESKIELLDFDFTDPIKEEKEDDLVNEYLVKVVIETKEAGSELKNQLTEMGYNNISISKR